MTGASYTMTGGFWVIPECLLISADYDGDCDVDQADYSVFEACASGPHVPHGVDCSDRDFDRRRRRSVGLRGIPTLHQRTGQPTRSQLREVSICHMRSDGSVRERTCGIGPPLRNTECP